MTLVFHQNVVARCVDEALAVPTLEQRSSVLRSANLLNAEGLDRLLDFADRLVSSDPRKAQRLATLCADLADQAAAPAAGPRASYVRAQTHAANGEFDAALRMAEDAYEGYVACGKNLEALRTRVGRMSVLLELGLYREALDAGEIILDTLYESGELEGTPTREQVDLFTALVYQNRGGCYEYMGRYEEALGAYAVAEERYRALGMTEHLGEILDNRGAILLHLGRGNEALAAHEAAAAVFADAGLTLSQAKALSNIGEANRQLANYRRSLDACEQARRLYDSLGALADQGLLLIDTASVYLDLNLYGEALAAYEKAHALYTQHRDGPRSRTGAMGHELNVDRSIGVRRGRERAGRSRGAFRGGRQRTVALGRDARTGSCAGSTPGSWRGRSDSESGAGPRLRRGGVGATRLCAPASRGPAAT